MSVLQLHGFHLKKWVLDSPEFEHSVPASEISTHTVSLDLNTPWIHPL